MKKFILVAGVDYEFKGVDFRVYCDNRIKRLMAANKAKEDLTFQVFDFRKGEVVTREITFTGGKPNDRISKLNPSPFLPVGKSNYLKTIVKGETHYKFKDGQNGFMSILNVYEAVQKTGVDAPNTLAELSFFSHAWMGGPILVNSYDDGQVTLPISPTASITVDLPSAARDPDDNDPRAKDFLAPNMPPAALVNLRNAFRPDGFIWIWGCAFPRLIHEILTKIERHPSYSDSGVGDDTVFELTTLNVAQASLLESWLSAELGAPFPDRRRIVIKFGLLRYFFCKATAATYSHHAAKNAGVDVRAGLLGTYSDHESGNLPLMRVHPGFGRHLSFYQNYLGFHLDPDGRKYGVYEPAFTCSPPAP